ncbi:hypothetical protein ACLOJK_029024 [Asimina triloba]
MERYPRPEKEYQSFSLIYDDRSLDLICKDKDEAEVWFVGLKALVSRGNLPKWRPESKTDTASGANSPRTNTQGNSPSSSSSGSSNNFNKDAEDAQQIHFPYYDGSPQNNGPGKTFAASIQLDSVGGSVTSIHSSSSGGADNSIGRGSAIDTFRVSLSSAVSSSSQGSGHDDFDTLGDVYIWGEGTGDGVLGGGTNDFETFSATKVDALLPKTLESAVVLDAHSIACGSRHAALVTKQGEVFSWGEESGGRLGHGFKADVPRPKLIDALSGIAFELVACGEYHTCAVTLSGDLYTWGDGILNRGLLGHRNEVSHWIPKKVCGQMEGLHVSSISCGPWHTAIVTSAGRLFTFGDGTFGALGHGDRNIICMPREVASLKGLRTVQAACGAWHTAAIVEVMIGSSRAGDFPSGKLFTWGDGDKGRLGHGGTERRLIPACVASLVEPSFCRVACGNDMTIALTTSGRVYTMGSTVYGQLGNPEASGKVPTCVEGKIQDRFVEDIACGSYHVAVLTSRTEVYTWGKGANGRLGHGDTDDRHTPTLVEALKEKQVKSIVCGSSFTAAICLHKWVSSVDQSSCSSCRLPFGFRRKRHNCYNCGLVFCNVCSNKKSIKASLAPSVNKPYRVCDDCYARLKKLVESGSTYQHTKNWSGGAPQSLHEVGEKETLDSKLHGQLSRRLSSVESLKQAESRYLKQNKKIESSHNDVSRLLTGSVSFSKKLFHSSLPASRMVSRATSPVSGRSSPPHSVTPAPTSSSPTSNKVLLSDLKQMNDDLTQEVLGLKAQVEDLKHKSQLLEAELDKTSHKLKEANATSGEESLKCKAAKEVIKSLTSQLKEMAERLSEGAVVGKKPFSFASHAYNILTLASSDNLRSNFSFTHEPEFNGCLPPSCNGTIALMEEDEWLEQDETGVYITLSSLPGGGSELKRIRFRYDNNFLCVL